jgi:hypothetical protein
MTTLGKPRNGSLRTATSRLAGSLLALCALAGCSSADFTTGGPLTDNGSPGVLCSPVPPGGVLSDGFEALTNSGSAPAVVTKVGLADPRDLRVVAAYLVPIAGTDLYGVRSGFPPPAHLDPGVEWSQRENAAGGHIAHSKGHQVTNLLVVIKPGRAGGRTSGIYVYYTVADHKYRMETATGLHVVVGRGCSS